MIHRYEALNWSISNMAVRKLDSNEAVYTQFRPIRNNQSH